MRIIFNELKKIFNVKSIFMLFIISFVVYYMFIDFDVKVFPNGRPAGDMYRIAKRIIEQKGNRLEDGDLDYLKNLEMDMKKEADNYLKKNKDAKELGVTSYDKFDEILSSDKDENKKVEELYNNIVLKEGVDSFWELQSIDYIINMFENKNNNAYAKNEAQKARIDEINKTKANNDILPDLVFSNYNRLIAYSALLIIISIVFILGPLFVKDEAINMEMLQYTTKRGRGLYKNKVAAALIASFIVVTVELGILFTLFLTRKNTVEFFYNSSINSFLNDVKYWFDLTFLQYIILSIAIVYALALALALIICYVSRKSHRYITYIGISLLIAIVLCILVISETITSLGIFNICNHKFLVPGFIAAMFFIGIASLVIRYRKEKVLDII